MTFRQFFGKSLVAPIATNIASMASSFYHQLLDQPISKDNMDRDTSQPNSNVKPLIVYSYEKHLVLLQSLILWDKPYDSLKALACFSIGYWCLIWFSASMLSLIFTTCFVYTFFDLWRHRIWPEIRVPPTEDQLEKEDWMPVHPQALSAPELIKAASNVMENIGLCINWLLDLRGRNHAFFCLLVSSVLTMTAIAGQMVSGPLLLYSMLIILALTPGLCVHVLPSGWSDWIFLRNKENSKKTPNKCNSVTSPSSSIIDKVIEDLSARSVDMFDAVADHSKNILSSDNEPSDDSNQLKQFPSSSSSSATSLLERELGFVISSDNSSRSGSQEKDFHLASQVLSSSIFSPLRQSGITNESPSSASDDEEDAFVMISDKDLSPMPSDRQH